MVMQLLDESVCVRANKRGMSTHLEGPTCSPIYASCNLTAKKLPRARHGHDAKTNDCETTSTSRDKVEEEDVMPCERKKEKERAAVNVNRQDLLQDFNIRTALQKEKKKTKKNRQRERERKR